MQRESICFGNYKNGQKKKGSQKTYQPITKRKKKVFETFFKVMTVRKDNRSHKDKPMTYFFAFPQKGTSLYEGPFTMECWLREVQLQR